MFLLRLVYTFAGSITPCSNISPYSSVLALYPCETSDTFLTADLDVRNYLPDMKVSDFFSGIMRQFNMTCVGVDERQFQVLPLEDWYNNGTTIDVTKYMDAETADIGRVPLELDRSDQ